MKESKGYRPDITGYKKTRIDVPKDAKLPVATREQGRSFEQKYTRPVPNQVKSTSEEVVK